MERAIGVSVRGLMAHRFGRVEVGVIVKWRIKDLGIGLERCEFERETAQCLVDTNGRRCFKRTEWESYFDTWEEAHRTLLSRTQRRLEYRRNDVAKLEDELRQLESARPPEGA